MQFIVIILLIVLIGYLVYLHYTINDITKKIDYINSMHTNRIIESSTKNPILIQLILKINKLISINKTNYQTVIENQEQFDMAINNIAHDIRTPLTVASGYTQLLSRKALPEQEKLLKKITINLNDVETKLEDLLTYNRLLEGRVDITLEDFNLSSLAESKISNYSDAFKKNGISLETNIEKNIFVISDESIINRIFENALGNMLNYGINEGTVALTHDTEVTSIIFTNQTHHSISNYDRLFDRFYTEDLSRVTKNSGLGLYIIKELTILLGGEVTASGTETCFKLEITLPNRKQSQPIG